MSVVCKKIRVCVVTKNKIKLGFVIAMADNRDWPIYLQVITSGKNPFLMCVIEEKEKNGVLEESSSSSKWGKQKISVVLESRRDRIKQLPAPPPLPEDADFRYHVTSLVALNSKLYLMGEGFGLMVMDLAEEDENQWRRLSLLRGGKRPGLVEAVVGEDGFLYALKSDHTLHRIHHDHPRRQDKLIMDNSFKRLFGVSKKNIYIAMSEGMFCYDLKSRSLEIVGKNLGISLTALIPYDERYLCTYMYSQEGNNEMYYVPGIHVYDTRQHQWLPTTVRRRPPH